MSKISSWLKRTYLRNAKYKFLVGVSGVCCLWLMMGVAIPLALSAWSTLSTRTPLGSSGLVEVEVSAGHLTPTERARLGSDPTSVAAHQVKPSLKLVGIGQRLIGGEDKPRFIIGLLPEEASQVLKEGTQMSLRVEAPSFELLAQELLYSQRGQVLKRELDGARDRVIKSMSALWPSIQESLKRLLPEELAERVMKDERLLGHIKEAFKHEIRSKINLDELGSTVGESEALKDLGGLAFKHFEKKRLFKKTIGGALGEARDELGSQLKNQLLENDPLSDLLGCTMSGISVFGILHLSQCLRGLYRSRKIITHTSGKGFEAAKRGAVKSGAIDLLTQTLGSLNKESDKAIVKSKEIALLVNKQLKSEVLLKNFWANLSQNQALIKHLQTEYGDEEMARISVALKEVSSNREFSSQITKVGADLKVIAKRGLSALLLDQEGKGPNPLLLAVIQEQLSGRARPIVHITPGQGDALKPGHVFSHSDEDR